MISNENNKTGYFKAHIAGFNHEGFGLRALQNWWDDLKSQYDLSGDTLKICEASAVTQTSRVITATYEVGNIKRFSV